MKLPINYDKSHWSKKKAAREQYVKNQNGKCCHCSKDLNMSPSQTVEEAYIDKSLFPKGFFNHPIHLHHNHDTGMTIGAIHSKCNAYLWQYEGE